MPTDHWRGSASWRSELVQTKMIVFPSDDGFNVLIWGKWTSKSKMRVRSFDNRASMIALLENLRMISSKEARELRDLDFIGSCPLYSSNIDEETLEAHGFRIA
jgi:predicted DNA-binding WGR domain protein